VIIFFLFIDVFYLQRQVQVQGPLNTSQRADVRSDARCLMGLGRAATQVITRIMKLLYFSAS